MKTPKVSHPCFPDIVRAAMRALCATLTLAIFSPLPLAAQSNSGNSVFTVLSLGDYRHYATQFAADEREATGKSPDDEWPWMAANIPLFSGSDKQFEEMYYFRWYAWKKHLVHTPHGYIITEWLPRPNLPNFDALPDAASFHLGEARWLHDPAIARDDARFWLSRDSGSHKYSDAIATAARSVSLADGDIAFALS